ncbi:MAG: aminotransferase class III-fold pyridoxal phosphate-dependent enzyme, partial [Planctomycetes bacterium]|nr:aminotransferase class III-fold pyridoxal phosphate-dependent enzyme [Planctomycetota bacterium]
MSSDHLITTTGRPDAVMSRGQGSWLWDEAGNRYLDLVQGWAVNCLGHAPDCVADALARQARALPSPSPSFHNRPLLQLAAELSRLSGLPRAFVGTSGAEAVEVAIKLARTWGARRRDGAWRIVTMHGSYHGRTLAAMSASGKAGWESMFEPKVPGFDKVRPDDPGAVAAAIGPETCAVMLEPVLGEGGVIPFSEANLRAIRRIADDAGVLLIHDEIQTGIGRTDEMLAGAAAGVRPDILILGKGLGGGVPISAVLADERVASCVAPGEQGGTFTGHPLGCAAALAVLGEVGRPGFLAGVRHHGGLLRDGLAVLARQH